MEKYKTKYGKEVGTYRSEDSLPEVKNSRNVRCDEETLKTDVEIIKDLMLTVFVYQCGVLALSICGRKSLKDFKQWIGMSVLIDLSSRCVLNRQE
jgi:hypothetical protein